jgi:hypothetical protein
MELQQQQQQQQHCRQHVAHGVEEMAAESLPTAGGDTKTATVLEQEILQFISFFARGEKWNEDALYSLILSRNVGTIDGSLQATLPAHAMNDISGSPTALWHPWQ